MIVNTNFQDQCERGMNRIAVLGDLGHIVLKVEARRLASARLREYNSRKTLQVSSQQLDEREISDASALQGTGR